MKTLGAREKSNTMREIEIWIETAGRKIEILAKVLLLNWGVQPLERNLQNCV